MTEHLLKVLIVGDGNVGKSSFVHRYVSGQFNKTYKMTVGGRAALLYESEILAGSARCVRCPLHGHQETSEVMLESAGTDLKLFLYRRGAD